MESIYNLNRAKANNRLLAEALRDSICPEWLTMWMMEIIMGRDPRVTLRGINPKTGRAQEGRPSKAVAVEQVPSLEISARMFELLLLRRDGAPAQQIQLDADLRQRSSSISATVDLTKLASMSQEERLQLRQMLQKLVAAPQGAPELVPPLAKDPETQTPSQGTPELPTGVAPGTET